MYLEDNCNLDCRYRLKIHIGNKWITNTVIHATTGVPIKACDLSEVKKNTKKIWVDTVIHTRMYA